MNTLLKYGAIAGGFVGFIALVSPGHHQPTSTSKASAADTQPTQAPPIQASTSAPTNWWMLVPDRLEKPTYAEYLREEAGDVNHRCIDKHKDGSRMDSPADQFKSMKENSLLERKKDLEITDDAKLGPNIHRVKITWYDTSDKSSYSLTYFRTAEECQAAVKVLAKAKTDRLAAEAAAEAKKLEKYR